MCVDGLYNSTFYTLVHLKSNMQRAQQAFLPVTLPRHALLVIREHASIAEFALDEVLGGLRGVAQSRQVTRRNHARHRRWCTAAGA